MYTQVHYHNSINSSSEWSNSNSLAFWSVCCPENFVLPTLKWGGVFWSTKAHSPRTGHEPQASHKYTHLGRNRGRSGDRGLHPPCLDPTQASATASEGPPAPAPLGAEGSCDLPNPAWPEFQMSDAKWRGPMRSGGWAQAGPETFLLFQIPGPLVVDRGRIWGVWCSWEPNVPKPTCWAPLKKRVLAVLCSRWDLSPLTRDCTCAPARESQGPNHWTTGEIPWPPL